MPIEGGQMNSIQYALDTMIEGLPNEEYHAVDGLSSTQFDLMRKSMAAFKYRKEFKKESVAFDEGNLIHDAILLPHLIFPISRPSCAPLRLLLNFREFSSLKRRWRVMATRNP